MARFWVRLSLIALAAAVLAGLTHGFMARRSQRLAEDHAARAQKALDVMYLYHHMMKDSSNRVKRARLPSDKARWQEAVEVARHKLEKLEETAARHERLARYYGYQAPLRRTDPDSIKVKDLGDLRAHR